MKTYKKIDEKIFVVEQVEKEISLSNLETRIDILNQAIEKAKEEKEKLISKIDNYQAEKDEINSEIKEIKKLK